MWKAKVNFVPTDDPEKVKKCLSNFFETPIEKEGNYFETGGENEKEELDKLRQKIWERKIIDSARSQLLRNKKDGEFSYLFLNKQAAYAGKTNIIGSPKEAPLGVLVVFIPCSFIDYFTPKTEGGAPLI